MIITGGVLSVELGEKLKSARLEAGFSQRQLCGDTITRNMLSQIENGSAKPSYTTLKVLSSRLGKPISYFMPEAPSENMGILHRAAQASPRDGLEILKDYLGPDPMLEDWYCLLAAQCRMALAQQAITEGRIPYARNLLTQAEEFSQSRYFSLLKRDFSLLLHRAGMACGLQLPDNTEEMLLRAKDACNRGAYEKCLACLDAADSQPADWHLLRADALIATEQYGQAVDHLLQLPQTKELYARLELCYQKLRNFEKAYEYACKQR